MYYDAMICKLTTYGKDRNDAIEKSIDALDNYAIRGVTHNIPLLRDILTEPTFLSGTFTTNYLPEVYPEGFQGHQLTKVKFVFFEKVTKFDKISILLLTNKFIFCVSLPILNFSVSYSCSLSGAPWTSLRTI